MSNVSFRYSLSFNIIMTFKLVISLWQIPERNLQDALFFVAPSPPTPLPRKLTRLSSQVFGGEGSRKLFRLSESYNATERFRATWVDD